MRNRAIALAGVLQACRLVHGIATVGSAPHKSLACSMDSVFRFDAESVEAVYGGLEGLKLGIDTLAARLRGDEPEPPATGIAVTVLHLERKLNRQPRIQMRLREGIEDCAVQSGALEHTHPAVFNRLGQLYADTLSTMRPRIMVKGNPQYLGQPGVVAEVRSLLLAAIRSAVLWRQKGGNYFDLFLRRGALLAAVDALREDCGSR